MPRALPRIVRQVLVAAAALVALLVARPAFAASRLAPQCDQRAAVTFAPPPTLQLPDASIDLGRDDCLRIGQDDHVLRQGRGSAPVATAFQVDATLPPTGVTLGPPSVKLLREVPVRDGPRAGVRAALERPPQS